MRQIGVCSHSVPTVSETIMTAPSHPSRTSKAKSDDRQARLAEALRANLKRRKAKTRAVAAGMADAAAPETETEQPGEAAAARPDSGPIVAQKDD